MRLTDGTRSILVSQSGQAVDLTGWDATKLSMKLPANCGSTVQLQARATTTEPTNGSTATTTQAFTVVVLSGTAVATPATANPYVTLAASPPVTTDGTDGTNVAPQIVVGTPIITASGQLSFTAAPPPSGTRTAAQSVTADQAEASVLTTEWLAELEAAAIANWSKLMGQ